MSDVELLAKHREGSESAFATLVRSHLGWVCGLARRRLRDEHMAEDVAQAVFVLLHRKAPVFGSDGAMVAWLHKAAWYASESAARQERRRRNRETVAATLRPEVVEEPCLEWLQLAPILDELIERLSKPEREAILLRYYRDLGFAEVAEQIGATPEAARKRVDRAIEKLRGMAQRKGLTISAAALPALLAANVRVIPTPGLVTTATVTATAQAGSALALSTGAIVNGAIWAMTGFKLSIGAALVAVILIVGATSFEAGRLSTHWDQTAAAPDPQPAVSPLPKATPVPTPTPTTTAPPAPTRKRTSFPVNVWTPSPFQAIRWPGTTPEVEVNGMWYELVSVNGVPVDRIVRLVIEQQDDALSCYQFTFESDMLNYVNKLGGNVGDFSKATLEVKDLATGRTQTLQDVPATAENLRAPGYAPMRDERAKESPRATLQRAISAIANDKMDDLFDCFDSPTPAQRDQLARSIAYPALCMQINSEISQQFTHAAVGPIDHFFKPFWWVSDLNEFDTHASAKIDLRSVGLGEISLHKTGDVWKIDPAWITDNAEGMDRLSGFLPNLQEFEANFKAGEYTSAEQLRNGITKLQQRFTIAIPRPKPEP